MYDSYSSIERLFLETGRRILLSALKPITVLLGALGVSPNMVSLSQVILGGVMVFTLAEHPRLTLFLFLIALLVDALDGALARHTNRCSQFGAILDQFCDHVREVLLIASLARVGALAPFLATLYAITLPGLNLTLFLCNRYGTPLPVAIKSYLVVYPAIFLYLWSGINWMNISFSICVILMSLFIVQGMLHLQRALAE
jgi:phosphatidylglycerophosphate synthase